MRLRLSLLTLALSAAFALPALAQDAAALADQAQTAYAAKDYARSADLYAAAAIAPGTPQPCCITYTPISPHVAAPA